MQMPDIPKQLFLGVTGISSCFMNNEKVKSVSILKQKNVCLFLYLKAYLICEVISFKSSNKTSC